MLVKYAVGAFIGIFLYFGFFCFSKNILRDYGSCKEKIVLYTFGNKKVKIVDNAISEFATKENIQLPESYFLTSECRYGYLGIEVLSENYRVNRESIIENLEYILSQKLIDKKDDPKYIEDLKPKIQLFFKSLKKRDLKELDKILTSLE